jgi:hypothetical protein
MGYYVELPENLHKAEQLIKMHGAVRCEPPHSVGDLPDGETLICVAENGPFDAAAIVYSDGELRDFGQDDGRRKHWLLVPTEIVIQLNPDVAALLGRPTREGGKG